MGFVLLLNATRPHGSPVYRDAIAAKLFKSSVSSEAIRRELNVWLTLTHVNILPLLAIGTVDDELAAISPWRLQGTLAGVEARVVNPRWLGDALRQTGAALAFAWSRGVLHLDVKPENVFLTSTGKVEVGDWGIAKLASELDVRRYSTSRQISGTLPYMAPERYYGHAVGPATDIFSLGMTAVRLIGGALPFHADAPVPEQICSGSFLPRALAQCSGDWSSWAPFLARSLALNPSQRFTDYATFIQSIPRH